MSDHFEQLAARNLESTPLSVRPRLRSRFESEVPSGLDVASEEQQESHDSMPQISEPRHEESTQNESPGVEQDARMPQYVGEAGSDDLSRRIDGIDERLRALPTASELTPPVMPNELRIEHQRIGTEETHYHQHEHNNQELHWSENITQSITAPATNPTLNEQRPRHGSDLTPTPLVLEPEDKQAHRTDLGEPSLVQPDVQQPSVPRVDASHQQQLPRGDDKATRPSVVAPKGPRTKTTPPAINVPRPQPTEAERPVETTPRQQTHVPKIAIEKNTSENQGNHTVTVTIGRIEVRPPQKASTAPKAKPKTASPRIMSLDDYVRQRGRDFG